jgi:hypothetical protein
VAPDGWVAVTAEGAMDGLSAGVEPGGDAGADPEGAADSEGPAEGDGDAEFVEPQPAMIAATAMASSGRQRVGLIA